MPHWTDTGTPHVLSSDSIYSSNRMTGSSSTGGLAAPPGAKFAFAKVWSITGGSSPQLQIRNGRSNGAPLVRTVAAAALATIDQRGSPDPCADGLWVTVTGEPRAYEVEIYWL